MRWRRGTVSKTAAPSITCLLLLFAPLGCDEGTAGASDAGLGQDAAALDATVAGDTGTPPDDAGLDAAVSDLGFALDASAAVDSGILPDAGARPDAGASSEPAPGDLVIVEIQGNPQNTADTDAEYVELLNVSSRSLNLEGCRLTHRLWAGGMAPVDSVGNHLINSAVNVGPGERVLLGRSGGGYFGAGVVPDYVYSGFEFSNGGSDNNRIRVMHPGWDGTEPPAPGDIIDEVIAPAGTFDNPLRGRSWQLDPGRVAAPTAASNDDPQSWCSAAANNGLAYWQSNWGTPRAANVCN